MRSHRFAWQLVFITALAGWPAPAPLSAGDAADFQVPEGFAITRFADDALAHDIFSMTLDPRGRVVVSGPGYIRTLHDDDGDGVAERASLYATLPKSGAQGLCFSGTTLLATGDGALLQFTDADQDDAADGPPRVWARLRNPEHGAHAIVQGPDGWFYVVCGNDTGVADNFVNSPRSPVDRIRCGAIVRFSPDGQRREIVAHGFRNPYDVDFTSAGNLLTVDSDGERDQHLPWYEPTRMFDVAQGREHGWLEGGWTKSWSRPECFFDNVERACEFGRGSPTGLIFYRHRQFPHKYRGGVFAACWTFGLVYFVPLVPSGSTVRGQPEVFARAIGSQGLAPVDLAVSPDGDLFIAIGGRKTRGGVYRIRYGDAAPGRPAESDSPASPLEAVLAADQPLAAWSRARWQVLAEGLGRPALEAVLAEPGRPEIHRIRAIEVLVDHLGGLSPEAAAAAIECGEAAVLARVAWALARGQASGDVEPSEQAAAARLLARLTRHDSPTVQRAAWEALAASGVVDTAAGDDTSAMPDWGRAMASSDRRVRAAMIGVARGAGRAAYQRWSREAPPIASSSADTARLRIGGFSSDDAQQRLAFLAASLDAFERGAGSLERLEALRLVQLGLGDLRLAGSEHQAIPGYTCLAPLEPLPAVAAESDPTSDPEAARAGAGDNNSGRLGPQTLAERLSKAFPSGDLEVDREIARTLGLLGCAPTDVAARIAQSAEAQPTASATLHYLFVLCQIAGAGSPERTRTTAAALVGLHDKLASRQEFPSRNWSEAVGTAIDQLVARDPDLPRAILDWPHFGRAEHSLFLPHMPAELRPLAASRLFEQARQADEAAAWTPELIHALYDLPADALPADEVLSALRLHWDDFRLRDAIVRWLARSGRPEDRARLVEALGSSQPDVVRAAAVALARLPEEFGPAELASVLAALRQASSGAPRPTDAKPANQANLEARLWQQGEPVRAALGELLRHASGRSDASNAYEPWLAWFRERYPSEAANLGGATEIDQAAWTERLAHIDWTQGDPAAGQRVFEKQSCHRCHRGDNRLGPDLAGVAPRMTHDDLFAAIYDPQREVAPAYRTTLLATHSGQVYHGLVVYESPDGTLLQTTPDITVRVTGDELLVMQSSDRSLMPTGLLDGLSDAELADLAAYLRTLTQPDGGR